MEDRTLDYNNKGRRTLVKKDTGIRTGKLYGPKPVNYIPAILLLVVFLAISVAFSYVPEFRSVVVMLLGG